MFHGDGLPTIDRVLAYGNDYFLIPFTFWSVLQSTAAAAKAIRDSGMNLNPEVDGTMIRVPIPKWVLMPELIIMQDNTEGCSECPSEGKHAWLLHIPMQLLSKEFGFGKKSEPLKASCETSSECLSSKSPRLGIWWLVLFFIFPLQRKLGPSWLQHFERESQRLLKLYCFNSGADSLLPCSKFLELHQHRTAAVNL